MSLMVVEVHELEQKEQKSPDRKKSEGKVAQKQKPLSPPPEQTHCKKTTEEDLKIKEKTQDPIVSTTPRM
jgi:hypothetical protein